jgi:hypothetical protein
MDRCQMCGAVKPLNDERVCVWRTGCEDRVARHEAEMARLYDQMAMLDPLPCGHTGAEHAGMRRTAADWLRAMREGYDPDPLDE